MSSSKPVTLITGASSGIGAALAEVFASHGHALFLTARRVPELQALADKIASKGRPRPYVFGIDLALPDAGERLAQELDANSLAVQHVVNNAGFGLLGQAAETSRAAQLSIIEVNVRALTDLSLRFVESAAQQAGGILNVASIGGFFPRPGMAVYHATKAYTLSFSEALHHELKPRGVKVSVLCPGPVHTGFSDRAGIPKGYFPDFLTRTAEQVAREAYEGYMRNQRVVVPGFPNRLITRLSRILPRGPMMSLFDTPAVVAH